MCMRMQCLSMKLKEGYCIAQKKKKKVCKVMIKYKQYKFHFASICAFEKNKTGKKPQRSRVDQNTIRSVFPTPHLKTDP